MGHARDSHHDYVELWVIFEHPADYPDGYIVRRQRAMFGRHSGRIWVDPIGYAYDSLDAGRAALQDGLKKIGRNEGEQTQIKEVWV